MITFIIIAAILFTAGFIQGFSGFGSALLAMPLLTVFIDVKIAVPLCMLNSLLITSYLSLRLKDHIELKNVLPLFLGSLPGVYIGIIFLKNMEADIIKGLLGAMIVLYCVFQLTRHPVPRTIPRIWAYIAGFCTGFIGAAFSAGGPPAIIYTTLTGWPKDRIKATLTGFFLAGSIVTAAAHAVSGVTTMQVVQYFLLSSLFILSGVYIGSRLYDRTNTLGYIKVILIILLMLGIMMICTAIA